MGKRAAAKPEAKAKVTQPKKKSKSSSKEELPKLSEEEKKKYKSQWDQFRTVIWFH